MNEIVAIVASVIAIVVPIATILYMHWQINLFRKQIASQDSQFSEQSKFQQQRLEILTKQVEHMSKESSDNARLAATQLMLARVTEQYNAEQTVLHDLGVPDDLIITKEFVEKEILPNAKKELILRSYLSFFDMLAKAVEANVLDRELVIFIFGGRIRAVFDRWKAYIDANGDNSYLEWRRLVEEVNRRYPK